MKNLYSDDSRRCLGSIPGYLCTYHLLTNFRNIGLSPWHHCRCQTPTFNLWPTALSMKWAAERCAVRKTPTVVLLLFVVTTVHITAKISIFLWVRQPQGVAPQRWGWHLKTTTVWVLIDFLTSGNWPFHKYRKSRSSNLVRVFFRTKYGTNEVIFIFTTPTHPFSDSFLSSHFCVTLVSRVMTSFQLISIWRSVPNQTPTSFTGPSFQWLKIATKQT